MRVRRCKTQSVSMEGRVVPSIFATQMDTFTEELNGLRARQQEQDAVILMLRGTIQQLQDELAEERKHKKPEDGQDVSELKKAVSSLQKEVESGFLSAAAHVAVLEKRMIALQGIERRVRALEGLDTRLSILEDSDSNRSRSSSFSEAAAAPSPKSGSTPSFTPAALTPSPKLASTPSFTPPRINVANKLVSSAEAKSAETRPAEARPEPSPSVVTMKQASAPRFGGGGEPCSRCGKTVYAAERIIAQGHVLHRDCFRCAHCDMKLQNSPNWDVLKGDFYCQPHFLQRVRTDGGRAKNELQEKELSSAELRAMIAEKLRAAEQEFQNGLAMARRALD